MRSVDRLSPAYRAYIQRLGKTHAVESHEDGRRRQLTRLFVEEVEPRDELLIETRDLTDRKSCVQGFRSASIPNPAKQLNVDRCDPSLGGLCDRVCVGPDPVRRLARWL